MVATRSGDDGADDLFRNGRKWDDPVVSDENGDYGEDDEYVDGDIRHRQGNSTNSMSWKWKL